MEATNRSQKHCNFGIRLDPTATMHYLAGARIYLLNPSQNSHHIKIWKYLPQPQSKLFTQVWIDSISFGLNISAEIILPEPGNCYKTSTSKLQKYISQPMVPPKGLNLLTKNRQRLSLLITRPNIRSTPYPAGLNYITSAISIPQPPRWGGRDNRSILEARACRIARVYSCTCRFGRNPFLIFSLATGRRGKAAAKAAAS